MQGPTVGDELREAAIARSTERMISWFRIIGGLAGIVLTLTDQVVHPPLERALEVGSLAALALLGVGVLAWLRTDPAPGRLRRGMRATYVVDAVVLLAQVPLHAFVVLEAPSPALLVPLLGAVRFGYRGAIVGTVGVAGAFGVKGALAVAQHDLPFGVDPAVVSVLLAAIVGLITAHLYETALAGRAAADGAHTVLSAGVGGTPRRVAERLAAAVTEVTAAGGTVIELDLRDGPPLRAVAGDVAIDGRTGDVVELPVRHGDVELGSLRVVRPTRLVEDLPEFARQVALAVDAARLLDEEAAIAARHRALDLLRTDFVALTSHELRTPVAAILGAAETLLTHHDDLGPDGIAELHDLVHRQGRRLERLVDDLVTMGRSDAGTLDYRPKYVAIGDLVAAATATVGHAPRTDGAAETLVWLDPDRGEQVLANLVDNAFGHGLEPVEVRWWSDDDRVVVEVSDAGPGLPPDVHDTVFERFVQLGPITNHSRGTGLGLGISRDLTRAMGGEVRIDVSAPSTTFVVELPTHPTAAATS